MLAEQFVVAGMFVLLERYFLDLNNRYDLQNMYAASHFACHGKLSTEKIR